MREGNLGYPPLNYRHYSSGCLSQVVDDILSLQLRRVSIFSILAHDVFREELGLGGSVGQPHHERREFGAFDAHDMRTR